MAASHLNKDPPAISDAEGWCDEERQEAREEERDSQPKRPSLEVLLGPLPTAASLGLSDSIHKCVGEEKENEKGEARHLKYHASHSVQFSSHFLVDITVDLLPYWSTAYMALSMLHEVETLKKLISVLTKNRLDVMVLSNVAQEFMVSTCFGHCLVYTQQVI